MQKMKLKTGSRETKNGWSKYTIKKYKSQREIKEVLEAVQRVPLKHIVCAKATQAKPQKQNHQMPIFGFFCKYPIEVNEVPLENVSSLQII